MRILLAASTLDPAAGGLPVCVAHLAAALEGAGHEVAIVGQAGGSADLFWPGIPAHVPVEAIRRPWTIAGQAAAARAMGRYVRDWLATRPVTGQAAVIHTHGVWTPAIIAAAETAIRERARLVISPHGMLRREAMRRSRLAKGLTWAAFVRRQLGSAAAVHVTSHQEAEDLNALLPGIEPVRIPWGIEHIPGTGGGQRCRNPRVAAFLGRMLPIKGIDMLVDAWAAVRPAGWLLRLAGPCDARMAALLRSRIESHDLASSVRIEPAVPHTQLGAFLAGTDLFVLPSRSENFGIAAGEALAAGIPVVTTTATAWTDVGRVGCGWCVPPDTQALAAALRTATSRPIDVLQEMGHRGTAWIARDFSWPAIASELTSTAYRPR